MSIKLLVMRAAAVDEVVAPSVLDSNSGSASQTDSVTASVTPSETGAVICVLTFGVNDGGCPPVSSVTATGLTFALRKRANTSAIGGAELWWAAADASTYTITVTYAATFDVACINVLAVSGADPVAPWDVDPSLPAVFASDAAATPNYTVSTHNAGTLLLIGFGMASNWANWESAPPGFDLVVACADSGAVYPAELTTVVQSLSAPLSAASITWPAPPDGLQSFATEAILDALRS